MNKKNAILISNGDIIELDRLKEMGNKSDFILSADGGTDYCLKASLMPNMVIGDLDSISKESLSLIREKKIPLAKFPTKKDATDTELSVDYLIQEGFKDITLVGSTGSRMDHTLGNIFLLNKLHKNGIKARIIDRTNEIYLVDDEIELEKEDKSFVSIIPISNTGAILTLEGFEYELKEHKISFSSTQGISNKIIENKGHIQVHEGICLVFISKD